MASALQKIKGSRRKKDAETAAEVFQHLTDDEKSDIVSQAIEALQKEIDEVLACWLVELYADERPPKDCCL